MLPDDHVVNWEEFRTAFRTHHIPDGLVERKLNEFLAVTQRTHYVSMLMFFQMTYLGCHRIETLNL